MAEAFYRRFRKLMRECRDAVGGEGIVRGAQEYRFDIEIGDRRFAFQALPQEDRVLVGEEIGSRGVEWFDELIWDEVSPGWRTRNQTAWELAASLSERPPLREVRAVPLQRFSRVAESLAYAALAWRGVKFVSRRITRPRGQSKPRADRRASR